MRRPCSLAGVATLSAVCLLLTAWGNGTRPASAAIAPPPLSYSSSTLVIATDAVNTDLDPASAYTAANINEMWPVYQGLTTLSGSSVNTVAPQLATSWTHSPNYRQWTFNLRKGVRFSDGTPFNAAAVKANYVRTVTLNLGAQFDLVTFVPKPQQQIVIVNPYKIRFDLLRPYEFFPLVMADQYGMLLVSPSVFKNHSLGPKDQGDQYLQTHAVGTGPYEISSFQPGAELVLVRNPDYWGGWHGSHFKKVIFTAVADPGARANLFLGGGADITYLLTPETQASIASSTKWAKVNSTPDAEIDYIDLGVYGPLKSPFARQALNYAFDYSGFVNGVMRGTVRAAHGVLPSDLLGFDPSIPVYKTNLAKAKALFAKAGIRPGTTLTYEFSPSYGEAAGEVLQGQLAQIGIHLKLVQRSYSTFLSDFYNNSLPLGQRANMYGWAYWPDYDDPSVYSIPNFTPAGYGSGNELYDNPTATRLINAAASTGSTSTIISDYRQIQQIVDVKDPAWIPVDQSVQGIVYRCDIHGIVANPFYIRAINPYSIYRSAHC